MSTFITIQGAAAPLRLDNIDTDVIVRIERLAALSKEQLGPFALEALRFRPDGSEDPACVLNQPAFRGASILLAGANFGCGSSREAAVWALMGIGIRCVIAPSFGDIFFGNCFQNGMLPIRLTHAEIGILAQASRDGAPLEVDLHTCTIKARYGTLIRFTVDEHRREALLSGLDDIDLTLRKEDSIRAWQQRDRNRRPWVWSLPSPAEARAAVAPITLAGCTARSQAGLASNP